MVWREETTVRLSARSRKLSTLALRRRCPRLITRMKAFLLMYFIQHSQQLRKPWAHRYTTLPPLCLCSPFSTYLRISSLTCSDRSSTRKPWITEITQLPNATEPKWKRRTVRNDFQRECRSYCESSLAEIRDPLSCGSTILQSLPRWSSRKRRERTERTTGRRTGRR